MIGFIAVPLLVVLLQYGSFNPNPLEDLTINLNIKDSLRDVADNELEADNENENVAALIIGGVSQGGEPLKDLEVFVKDQWRPLLPDLPTIRSSVACDSFQDRIYVTGGLTSADVITAPDRSAPVGLFTMWADDDVAWSNLPELRIPRHRHTATIMTTPTGQKMLYVTGGWEGRGSTSSVEIYHYHSKKWNEGPNLNKERYDHAAVVFKDQLHVIGGRGKVEGLTGFQSVEIRYFQENSWKLQPKAKSMPVKRFSHAAVSVNDGLFGNIIIVCGGRYIENKKGEEKEYYVNVCMYFDGDKWYSGQNSKNVVGSMKERRAMFGMVVIFGRLWAFGGFNGQEVLTSMESCPVDSNRERVWTLSPKEQYLKKPRMMFGVAFYTDPQISNKKRLLKKLESTNAINSTFV